MANPSKDKGTRWERVLADYCKEHGFPYCDRRPLNGSKDKGDLGGLPFTVSAKFHSVMSLGVWANEVVKQAVHAGTPGRWVIFHHRVGRKAPGEGWATTSVEVFVELLRLAEIGRQHERPYPGSPSASVRDG